MARKRRRRGLVVLLLIALGLFVGGELLLFSRSDTGKLFLARHGLVLSRAETTQILSRAVRNTLRGLGVPAGAQEVTALGEERGPRVRWRVQLPPRASLLQVNAALATSFESRGGRVFDAWEERDPSAGNRVTMHLGVGRLLTHEVVLLRRPGDEEGEIVRVALVLEGFAREDGDSLARVAIDLPFEFAGAVRTNARGARRWADALAESNREVVAHVPMEPLNYPSRSPGKDAILVDQSRNRIRRLMRGHLRNARRPVACLAYMGGMALQDDAAMAAVMAELGRSEVAYVEIAGRPHSRGLEAASEERVPYLRIDGRLDPGSAGGERARRRLREQLDEIADTARRRGFASCVAQVDPALFEVLRREVPRLEAEGVRFVPLSALLRPSVL